MKCIGVDVSKQLLVTYDGVKERLFPNRKGLPELAEFLDHGREVRIVFETTSTYSRKLEAFCQERGLPTVKLDPGLIPNLRELSRKRSKTDQTDAELLYRYGTERGEAEAKGLPAVDHLTQAISIQLAIYRVTQKARVAYQGLLEALSQDPFTPKELLAELTDMITSLKEREQVCIAQAQELIEEEEGAAGSLQVLLSIPGVGPITAITLLTLFRRYPHTNRREIVALAGLDPLEHRSGSAVHRKPRISKRGDGEVRKRLYEATLPAARFNLAVKEIYRRLKEWGKPEKVARIAAARKLLLIAHALYKSGELYRVPKEAAT
ncbi:MAG: IS110 family transposase [Candidatus Zipacnadales bacterium]